MQKLKIGKYKGEEGGNFQAFLLMYLARQDCWCGLKIAKSRKRKKEKSSSLNVAVTISSLSLSI